MHGLFLVALERRFGGPVIITSTQGGSNIEGIAAEHPDAIIQYPIDIEKGLVREEALKIAEKLGFRNQALEQVRFTPCLHLSNDPSFARRLIQC